MAATIAGTATSGQSTNVTSHVATLPASIAAGELIIVIMAKDGVGTATIPASWVEIADGIDGALYQYYVAYLFAAGGETSVTITTTVAEHSNILALRITGAHASTPPEISAVVQGASTAPDPGNLDPAGWGSEDTRWIALCVLDGGNPVTGYPANYPDNNLNVDAIISAAYIGLAARALTASAENPGAFAITTSDNWSAFTIAVRPGTGPQTVSPGAIALTLGAPAPQVNQTVSPAAIGLTLGLPAPTSTVGGLNVTPAAIALALGIPAPIVSLNSGPQTVSPGTNPLTLGTPAPSLSQGAPVIVGNAGLPNPRLVIAYYTNNSSTFGPAVADGIIEDASEVGWSWYSRYPSNAFFTLPQNSRHNPRLVPLLTHIQIWYVNEATGLVKLVFTGRLGDSNETTDDVVWTAWNYLSELSLSRTGYRTLYPQKLIGTEIASPEWTAARTATFSILNHVATGTIEDPLGSDNVTPIRTDNRFGVIDVPRLLLLFDLTELGRANTVHNVTFEITRNPPFTFNFWKDRGSAITTKRLTYPGAVRDFQFVPGYNTMRNDLATIGTTVGGGATEIIKTDEVSAGIYGRRQDVFTIKTIQGLAGAATESDAQVAITARAVKEASQLSRSISLDVRNDLWEPFDGWELEDTVPVQIIRGRTAIDAPYRIIGTTGRMDAKGYHPTIVVQLPTAP